MSHLLPAEGVLVFVLWFAGCAWLIWRGVDIGFRKQEARQHGRVVAKGREARKIGVAFICFGALFGLCLVAAILLIFWTKTHQGLQ